MAGVCLMVGALFFAMILVDKTMEWLGEQWNREAARHISKSCNMNMMS